jgi:hypothetical protein
MLLPSIESFLQQWRLPKVHYLFYEYFYKAVIKDSVGNDRIDAPRPSPDKMVWDKDCQSVRVQPDCQNSRVSRPKLILTDEEMATPDLQGTVAPKTR